MAIALLMTRFTQVASEPVHNGDTWFHLRLGRELGWPWQWASVDHWSTFGTSPWVPTQPLAQQAMSGVESVVGIPGIAWLYGAALIVLLLTVYGVCRRHASPLVAALVTGLAMVGAAGSLSPRPQVISLVLIILVADTWLRTESDGKPRWWLIPLTWLWSMCHGFWVIGVMIGCVFAAGLVLNGTLRGKPAVRVAAVPVLSVAAACLTPLGPALVLAPLTVNARADLISEWQRTSFLTPTPWPVVVLLGAALLLLAARRRLTLPQLLLLASAAVWIVLSVRTVAVAGLMAAPLAAIALQTLVPSSNVPDRRTDIRVLAGVGAVLLAVLAAVVPQSAAKPGSVPTSFDARLDELPSGSTILDDSAVGGWLAWRHPDLNVVVDGMFDAYPVDHLRAAIDAEYAEPGWEDFVAGTGATVAILSEDSPLAQELARSGWVAVGRDEGYVLLDSPQLRR